MAAVRRGALKLLRSLAPTLDPADPAHTATRTEAEPET
jgi:hypothetical protein